MQDMPIDRTELPQTSVRDMSINLVATETAYIVMVALMISGMTDTPAIL